MQLGAHARSMRSLTSLPGGPAVIALAHPKKNPDPDNLLPRGGGAFLAEVDGNLVCLRSGSVVEVHWHGKFRGPDFDPVPFMLTEGFSATLRDKKGRLIKMVTAHPAPSPFGVRLGKLRVEDNESALPQIADIRADVAKVQAAPRPGSCTAANLIRSPRRRE